MMLAVSGTAPFVGRSVELGKLTAALEETRRGSGSLILVTGDAGIGKTRLATEVLAVAQRHGSEIAMGRAWEGPGTPAFYLWSAAFSSIRRELAVPRPTAHEEVSFAAIETVVQQVRTLGRERPIMVLLDDLQWADAPSLSALHLLARNPVKQVLVVGTLRVPDLAPRRIGMLLEDLKRDARDVIALGGLTSTDLVSLARSRGLEAERVVAAIQRASDGNPFLAHALLDDSNACTALVTGNAPSLPRGARALLSRRLSKLGEQNVQILAGAAFGPQPLDAALVAKALGSPQATITATFNAAQAHGVIVRAPDGSQEFAHDLLRVAARDALEPTALRRELHRGWARALQDSEDPRKLALGAHHAFAGDPETCEEWPRCLAVTAATAAAAAGSHHEAATLFELAAVADERAGRNAAAARMFARAAEALTSAGDPADGHAAARRALALARRAGDPVALATAAVSLGLRRTEGAADPALIELLEEALRGLEAAPPSTVDVAIHCAVEARLAAALQPFIDPMRALELGRRSIERARASKKEALLAATIHRARPAFRPIDDLQERLTMDSELLFLATKLGDNLLAAQARARLCYVSIERGDPIAFDTHLTAYETLASELDHTEHMLGVTTLRTMRATIRGNVEEAEQLIASIEATRESWTSSSAATLVIDLPIALRAALAFVTGDPGGYTALAAAPAPPYVRSMAALLAATRRGRLRDAAAMYARSLDSVLAPKTTSYTFRAILANAAIALRDVTGAKRLYPQLEAFRGRHVVWTPVPIYDGSIDRLLAGLAGVLGDFHGAASHFANAIASEEAFLARPFVERTRAERRTLECGRNLGELPPSLARVATLVVDGYSEKEVAERLGASPATIRTYVRRIYRRLGVHNRAELVRRWSPQRDA